MSSTKYVGDNTGWEKINIGDHNSMVKGQISSQNIFHESEGISTATKRNITTELDAFTLFITESVKHTFL